MWLLKLHISFSILCILTFWGFKKVFRETIEKNGWEGNQKKREPVYGILIFFTPILNLFIVVALFTMILTKKENRESGEKESKKEENET